MTDFDPQPGMVIGKREIVRQGPSDRWWAARWVMRCRDCGRERLVKKSALVEQRLRMSPGCSCKP